MPNLWNEPHTFVVEGCGEFPFDMLRHSMAWPATTSDALQIGSSGRRRVALVGAVARHIAPARWESFGWPVIDGFADGYPCQVERLPAEQVPA